MITKILLNLINCGTDEVRLMFFESLDVYWMFVNKKKKSSSHLQNMEKQEILYTKESLGN